MGDIAIVGIDCAFPGAAGVRAYWDLLMRGGAGIGPVPGQRWEARDFPAVGDSGGFIDDVDVFDSDFFSVTPREAAAMDPHHRLLLPCAWRALEDSGRAPGDLAGTETGVFIGVMGGEWGRLTMSDLARVTPLLGAGSSAGMAANRISYHFDFTGPSLAVDTACSSSLVAVHLAANSLLAEECDTALAGGVNIVLSPSLGLVYGQLGLAASDGRCKPFSVDADGICRSDGVGLVVLRRLDDALADGQRIYAVLRGSAVNQDGRSNGVIAPNRWSQERVLNSAYRRAGVTPDRVAFVEAHGTGTVLGDAIECAALGSVHGVPRDTPCAIGSVKGNLGHTEGAAGIAGLIKTALALHHRIVPASLFAERENSRLRLAERGLRLLKSPLRLPRGENLAGVSSFGMGGTNAHAVLGSAPRTPAALPARARTDVHALGVFTLSADSPEALRRNLAAQADAITARPRGAAAALCRSSNRIKTGLPYRYAVTVRDTGELVEELRRAAALKPASKDGAAVGGRPWGRPVVAFLFTGQGSEFPGMTAGLHRESPAYRRHLGEADEALAPHLGTSVRDLILGGDERVHRPEFVQPALFAVGYALARTLTTLGVPPAAVLGHSLGEYAAAVTAGALDLDEAARLVVRRAALMGELPTGGGMLAAAAGADELAWTLAGEPEVVVAALNGPADTVLSGPIDALARIGKELAGRGVRVKELPVTHAFHSPLMAQAAAGLRTTPVRCASPALPVASTRHGRMLRHEPMDADYWADQIEEPVLLDTALGALVRDIAPTHLIEIGPRTQLLQIAARGGRACGVELLHPAPGPEASGRDLSQALAALHRAGLDPLWEELYAPEHRTVEPLAPYVFSSAQRYWDRRPMPASTPPPAPVEERPSVAEGGPEPTAVPAPAPDAGDPVLLAVVQAVTEVGGYPTERVVREARFHEDLGFDSVMIMQLKNRVEARLPRVGEVSVQQMLPALRSVGSLAEFLGDVITERSA
ncbi:type I polyketide synthase [Streptomyces sp. NPDC059874]|uniref:type I polyketide synthase n=1 Tax=Streptomyces sp. NPDC059874 TaxID=3346983 RepID=UPI00364E6235